MPYRRSYRRSTYRSKRSARTRRRPFYRNRSFSRSRPSMGSRQKIHFFKRHVDLGTINLSNVGIATQGFSFQLDEVPNYTEFTALYDQYKICAAAVKFIPTGTEAQINPNTFAGNFNIRFATVIDYDSSGAFGSFNDAREFTTCKVKACTQYHTRYIKPRIKSANENDSNTIVASGNRRMWLNTNIANIPHYGLRYVFEQIPVANYSMQYKVEAKYYMAFRNVK